VTDEFVAASVTVSANGPVYDLEDTHSAEEPRVRQLKARHAIHPVYMRASRNPKVVELLTDLWGSLRYDTGKLDMESAGYGAPIEWHQDWAFYSHTNEDLAAVGIVIDDVDMENGPMMVVPDSHKGRIHDHHGSDGRFCLRDGPRKLRHRPVACRAVSRQGWLDHDPPRPGGTRLGD
jgi:phytanoyl-CoA hydroxylase